MTMLVTTIVAIAVCSIAAVQGQRTHYEAKGCPNVVSCPRGHQRRVHQPTGQVYCEPSCEIDNGGCPADKMCSIKSVECESCLPCPPTVECSDPDPCSQPADPGTCDCFVPSYFWNSTSKKCELFSYSGCGGNLNRFSDLNSCSQKCGPSCPPGMVYKECGPNCPETCDNNYDCQIIGPCSSGCFCPDDKVLSSNGTCIDQTECPGCETGIDLVIVLDVSLSIHRRKAVQPLLRFTRRIIQRLDIGLDSNLVGIVLFANDSRFHFGLQQHTSRQALFSAIDALSQNYPNRRQTYFVPVFNLLNETKDNSSFGFRPSYPDVAVIVTDGRPTDKPPETFTQTLEDFHGQDIYQLYAVGVGKANLTQLAKITGDSSTAFFANSLDDATLAKVAQTLTQRLCSRNCSIEGQIRKTHASHPLCHARCIYSVDKCPAAVTTDGCECPDGMVVYDSENKCVHPEQCPPCPIDGQIRKRYPTYSCDCYCDDPEDKVCDLIGREYGCECPDGMIINKAMNKCVYPRDCPVPTTSVPSATFSSPSPVPTTLVLSTTTSSPSPVPTTSVSSTATVPSPSSSRAFPTTSVSSTTTSSPFPVPTTSISSTPPVPTPSPSPNRTCPAGMVFNECDSNCPVTCDNYNNYTCQQDGCQRGCFCPYNKVLSSNGTCIDVNNCTDTPPSTPGCQHKGIEYAEGQRIQPNCSTICICKNREFHCEFQDVECGGSTCIIHGDPHYITFDQRKYDFMGLCEYYLSKPCVGNDFAIVGKNSEVNGDKAITATEAVRVIVDSQDLKIDLTRGRGGEVYINDVLQSNDGDEVLYSSVGVQVVRSGGHPTVFLTMRFPVQIHWDGSRRVRITASKEWQGQLCGLCGNYNDDHSDDLVLSTGSETTSVNDFGNSWLFNKTEENCPCLHGPPIKCSPDIRPIAESKCSVLTTVFGTCNSVVSHEEFVEACIYDYCVTGRDEEYFCDAISSYAAQCASAGVVIPNWRTPSFCCIDCPPGKVYQQCGPSCPQTCDTINDNVTCIGGGCTPGCFCPSGMVQAQNDTCISESSCSGPCEIKGYDLVIAIDETRSVDETEFKKILNFTTRIIEEVDIGEDHTKVGVILFDNETRVHFDLNQYTNKSSLLSAINQIEHKPEKGNNYSIVLQQLHKLSQDTSKGFRDGFDDIAVILTDAKNVRNKDKDQLPTILERITNYQLYAVGIALENRSSDQQLEDLALLTGDKSHVFIADSVTDEELDQIRDNLTVLLCERRPMCPQLTTPDNGDIDCSLGGDGEANSGDTCTFTCDDGHTLVGSPSRTCQDDRNWNGTDTTCTRVTIVSTPTGTPVSGSTNTFDYPILSSVTLACMVDSPPSGTVTYSWNTTGCYSNDINNTERKCFPHGQTTQNVSTDDVLAKDAGTVMCTATTDSGSFISEPFTFRISGVSVTTSGKDHESPGTDAVSANQLDDYSYIIAPLKTDKRGVVLRCATGLGPASDEKSTDLGDWYFHGKKVEVAHGCASESVFEVRQAHLKNFPGILNLYPCGNLTHGNEGVYSCIIKNSSMMNQTTRVGLYLSGRTAPTIDPPSLPTVTADIGDSFNLSCISQGSPPDTFTWMKDGNLAPLNSTLISVSHDNTTAVFRSDYPINSATTNDSGTYTCTVTNPIGSNSETITVTVDTGSVKK